MIAHTSVGSLTSLSFSCEVWHPASSFALLSFSPSTSSRDLSLSSRSSSFSLTSPWLVSVPSLLLFFCSTMARGPSLSVASSRSRSQSLQCPPRWLPSAKTHRNAD